MKANDVEVMGSADKQLLFCDTFNHEEGKEVAYATEKFDFLNNAHLM